uniref:Pectinesterase inhibitor domain-containing protein n=1 Tax=Kalanchoe fedtschenkoi TaxID=63787 RepID=A0A7N1A6U9_KALFE
MALSSPHLSICLLISIIYACINSQTIYSLNPLIEQVCAETDYPNFCGRFLSEHHRSAHATDKHALGVLALEGIIFHARSTFIDITYNYLLNPELTQEMRVRLQECSDEYNTIMHATELAYTYWTNNFRNPIPITSDTALANRSSVRACRYAIGADYPPLHSLNMDNERYQEILLTICDFNPHHQTSKMFKL